MDPYVGSSSVLPTRRHTHSPTIVTATLPSRFTHTTSVGLHQTILSHADHVGGRRVGSPRFGFTLFLVSESRDGPPIHTFTQLDLRHSIPPNFTLPW